MVKLSYWGGRPPVLFLLFIIAGGLFPGSWAFIFSGGKPIAFRNVAGSGIPGVGVNPGLSPFLSCSALGIPGVGVVPLGSVPLAGKPGTPFIGIGLPDKPGGILAGSNLMMFAFEIGFDELEFAEFSFDTAGEPHAVKMIDAASVKTTFLNIIKPLIYI